MSFESVNVHARNLTGAGSSLIREKIVDFLKAKTPDVHVINPQKSLLPNIVWRIFDVFFLRFFLDPKSKLITLGDIPLRGFAHQILFVQQAHLLKASVNPYVGTSLQFALQRFIFRFGQPYVKKFIVQTEHMKRGLMESYDISAEKILVVKHPSPLELRPYQTKNNKSIKLFFPASPYAHKNFEIIFKSQQLISQKMPMVEILLTCDKKFFPQLKPDSDNIVFLGSISDRQKIIDIYKDSDALLFPSKLESYGLPVVEAIQAGMPVICSNLPHNSELCGGGAYYFESDDPQSLVNAILAFISDLKSRQLKMATPWRTQSWDHFAEAFLT